jgi:hypothetical protein
VRCNRPLSEVATLNGTGSVVRRPRRAWRLVSAVPTPFGFHKPIGYSLEELPEARRYEMRRAVGIAGCE